MLYAEIVSATQETWHLLFTFGYIIFPVNALSKKKRTMRHGMSKPRGLKVRGCADSLINLNKYLYVLPGENISEKLCVIEIHGILLNSMPNIWSKQAYVQGFDSESIT